MKKNMNKLKFKRNKKMRNRNRNLMNKRSNRSHKAVRLATHSSRSKTTIRAMKPLLTKLIVKTSDGL